MAHRKIPGSNVIQFTPPRPGATAEERASVYGDALLKTAEALNAFRDELTEHTEQLIVMENAVRKLRETVERLAKDVEELKGRFSAIEAMFEMIMKRLALEVPPAIRDKMPTLDEIEDSVEKGVEKAAEKIVREIKTPATAFQVPAGGYTPQPTGLTSERVRGIVKGVNTEEQRDELVKQADKRGDMYRNLFVAAVGFALGTAILWTIASLVASSHGH